MKNTKSRTNKKKIRKSFGTKVLPSEKLPLKSWEKAQGPKPKAYKLTKISAKVPQEMAESIDKEIHTEELNWRNHTSGMTFQEIQEEAYRRHIRAWIMSDKTSQRPPADIRREAARDTKRSLSFDFTVCEGRLVENGGGRLTCGHTGVSEGHLIVTGGRIVSSEGVSPENLERWEAIERRLVGPIAGAFSDPLLWFDVERIKGAKLQGHYGTSEITKGWYCRERVRSLAMRCVPWFPDVLTKSWAKYQEHSAVEAKKRADRLREMFELLVEAESFEDDEQVLQKLSELLDLVIGDKVTVANLTPIGKKAWKPSLQKLQPSPKTHKKHLESGKD